MCGICGSFGDHRFDAGEMLAALLHRGPDGQQIKLFQRATLGFCRLDVYGPSGINQPVYSSCQDLAVVFNGEIYNFQELTQLFQNQFKISDEAELILHLYMRFGESCFKKLKGMFAIAIISQQKLILARDSLGIKPLLYCLQDATLYFASEIKALLRIWKSRVEIDTDALAEAAVFGFIFNLQKTMFNGISQVPPGSYLVFENNNIQINQFYDIQKSFYDRESLKPEQIHAELEALFTNTAAKYYAHSKHPQGIYLSGGIDSTLMAMFLQKTSDWPLNTFTLFDDPQSNDRHFASRVAEEFGTHHKEIKTDENECINFLDHYLYHYESLVTDGIFNVLGSLAFHILSYHISKSHKVVYCGEGADELFGGYYWMHAHPLGLGDRLRARSAAVNHGRTRIHEYIMSKFPDDDSKEPDMRREIFDFLMGPGLTNCHLWSVDRSSSAFSFEARPLYLYDDIRNWALSFPIEQKVTQSKETKLLLKSYAKKTENNLLIEVAKRKKIGMPAALSLSLEMLISHSAEEFQKCHYKRDLPHKEYAAYLHTDFEKLMFDKFYKIFVIDRGNKSPHLKTD